LAQLALAVEGFVTTPGSRFLAAIKCGTAVEGCWHELSVGLKLFGCGAIRRLRQWRLAGV